MTNSRLIGGLLLSIMALAYFARAAAAEPDREAISEARERYARGMHLFDNGDHAGALAEFERVQEILPKRQVLYQIAMVYVAMDKPVDALESLDEVLSDSGPLRPELVDRAKAAKEEQQRRIGELDVKVNVPAAIVIDGANAGDAPLKAPLSVAAGEHMVAVVAPGHAPARQSVTVAAQGRAELTFELEPTKAKLARVTLHSPLLGAEVRMDDMPVGKTPFAEPVAVLPGKHVFDMQRPGYMAAHQTVELAEGVYATVSFDPDEDPSAGAERGRLRVAAGAGAVQVTIDGRSRGAYRGPIELPAGLHTVKLERSGCEPLSRLVDVPAQGETELKVSLRPTAKTRASQVAHVRSYRHWAIAALLSGALVTGGSVGLALWSHSELQPAEESLAIMKQNAAPGGKGSCDPNRGLNPQSKDICDRGMAYAQNDVNKYRNLRLGGFVGSVAGAALLAVGVTILIKAPTAPREEGDDLFAGTLVPLLSAGPDGASLGLRGQF